MNETDANATPRIARLRDLEAPALPEALWPRVEARRRALFARRRRFAGVAAALLVAGGIGLLARLPGNGPDGPGVPTAQRVDSAPLPGPVVLQVRAIDRELQAAYQAGAHAEEIERLWRTRGALLASGGRAGPVEPLRI
ncbi:hypothetical protein [Luteimonas pelagia]